MLTNLTRSQIVWLLKCVIFKFYNPQLDVCGELTICPPCYKFIISQG